MNFLEIGQKINTQISAISQDYAFLDIGAKSEGILPLDELKDKNLNITAKIGDKIDVFFIGNQNGDMLFTTRISGDKANAELVESAWKNKIPVEGQVEKEIKGGFEIKIGKLRGFCPYSQMGFRDKKSPSEYIGCHLSFRVMEFKENGYNILFSNRIILEENYKKHIESLKLKIKPGSRIKAKVLSLEQYGAFVDIGNFKALLPISEISREKIQNINKVLSIGDELEVVVLKTDWEHEKVSVSRKSLLADPWDNAGGKYTEGKKFIGTISNISDFGLFIELEPGLEGLVHISTLDNADRNTNLRKVYKTGSKMSVEVTGLDNNRKRLSLKPATTEEQDMEAAKYITNQSDSETYNPFMALLKKK